LIAPNVLFVAVEDPPAVPVGPITEIPTLTELGVATDEPCTLVLPPPAIFPLVETELEDDAEDDCDGDCCANAIVVIISIDVKIICFNLPP
jgi:hypothetical protein